MYIYIYIYIHMGRTGKRRISTNDCSYHSRTRLTEGIASRPSGSAFEGENTRYIDMYTSI